MKSYKAIWRRNNLMTDQNRSMPTKAISDCDVLVAKAIAAERDKDYATAMVLYRSAIGTLMDAIEAKARTSQERRQFKDRVNELLCRAEKLQQTLDGVSRNTKQSKHQGKVQRRRHDTSKTSLEHGSVKQKTTACNATKTKTTSSSKTLPGSEDGSKNEAGREKEWSYKFDLKFDMRSRIVAPAADPELTESEKEKAIGNQGVMKMVRGLLGQ